MTGQQLALQTGDIFLTRSDTWLGRAIRFAQRVPGEEPSQVNHVGVILSGDDYHPELRETAVSIEALWKVRRGYFRRFYGPGTEGERSLVAVYRDVTLTPAEREEIYLSSRLYAGRHYGVAKIPLHAADWAVSRLLGRNVHAFRRLARLDRYPICSWLVAQAYASTGRAFGVPAGCASPDDIWDFVTSHPEKYLEVHPLRRLA